MNTSNYGIILQVRQQISEYCLLFETLSSAANERDFRSNNDDVFACQAVSNVKMETELKAVISTSLKRLDSKLILDTLHLNSHFSFLRE